MMYIQANDTPLDYAVRENNIDIVHFFIKECNQDISKIKQVCNCIGLFLILRRHSRAQLWLPGKSSNHSITQQTFI